MKKAQLLFIILCLVQLSGCVARYIGSTPPSDIGTALLDLEAGTDEIVISRIAPTTGRADKQGGWSHGPVYVSQGWWDISATCGFTLVDAYGVNTVWIEAGKRYVFVCKEGAVFAELREESVVPNSTN